MVRCLAVQLLHVVEEFEGGVQKRGTGAHAIVRLGELKLELGALLVDAVEALANLGLRELPVGGEVEKVLLPGVELCDLAFELVVQETGGPVLVGDGG